VDNLCHTLVGLAMGEAGLKRKTRYGNATLAIAANLPDLDVLVFLTSTPSVEFRRGWTHGVAAQLLLPVALTAAVAAFARCDRFRKNKAGPGLSLSWTFLLALAGVYSHVALDFLNNYGIRWLAPVDWRWFYGDAIFIIDIWLWLALFAGTWLSRRRQSPVPARGALTFAAAYAVAMLISAQAARGVVRDVWRELRGSEPHALMVGPLPITPFTRAVVIDAGDHYETGEFSWEGRSVRLFPDRIAKNDRLPAVAAARETRLIAAYLVWSRFPYWEVSETPAGTRVTVRDMRFGGAMGGRLAATVVVASAPPVPR
jgi:inner membrane protein